MKMILQEDPGVAVMVFYQTDDKQTRLEVRFGGETVWLTLNQMSELFQRDKSVISRHIRNVFDEGELVRERTVAKFATVQQEGDREVSREVEYFNLDVIISVGYRVKSLRGTQFRIWATPRLREYIVKGFTLDDERLKQAGGGYFDELLAHSRHSLFRKDLLQKGFGNLRHELGLRPARRGHAKVLCHGTEQNALGRARPEVVHNRANAVKPNMGLTNWKGGRIRREDAEIAKNYLTQDELEAFNLIVSAYLDFAELQARNRRVMHMADWIAKLDDFLKLSEREILTHAGRISHEQAREKAKAEYERFRAVQANAPSPVEKDFEAAVEKIKQLAVESKAKKLSKK